MLNRGGRRLRVEPLLVLDWSVPGRQSRPYGLRSVVQKAGPVLNGRDDTTLDVLALLRIGVAMGAFEDLHRKRITGSLAMLTA